MYEAIAGATAILIAPVGPYLSRRTLEAAQGVMLVQFLSVGYEKIDMDAATELGVPVANNAGFNAVAVAEHALMMILVLLKRAFYARASPQAMTLLYLHENSQGSSAEMTSPASTSKQTLGFFAMLSSFFPLLAQWKTILPSW